MTNENEITIFSAFPTSIYSYPNVFSNDALEYYANLCKEVENKIERGGKNWLSPVYNTLGTYNLVDDSRFDFMIQNITHHVKTFNTMMGSDYNYVCNDAWINSYKKGDYQEWHNHAGSTYSAVLFLKYPEGSAPIYFQSPSEPFNMLPIKSIKEYNSFNAQDMNINPEENSLIIFRSYLKHMVPVNNTEKRITIAFNF
jgi:uncharacterized protein (TIGR02466 family)